MSWAFPLAAGLALLFYGSGLLSLFTPLPVAVLFARRGIGAALLAILVSAVLLYLVYRLPKEPFLFLPWMVFYPHWEVSSISKISLLFFIYYGWIGLALPYVGVRAVNWEKSVGRIVLSTLLFLFVMVFLFLKLHGVSLFDELRSALHFLMNRLSEASPDMTAEEAARLSETFIDLVWHLFPSLAVNMTLVVVAVNLLFLRKWTASLPFRKCGDFSLWRLPESVVWIPVAAGFGYLVGRMLLSLPIFSWIALNVLVVAAQVYFFQGLSLSFYFMSRRLSPPFRLLLIFLFFMVFQAVAVALILWGLFDFWFDFRKTKNSEGRAQRE